MNYEQGLLFALFGVIFALLIWGRVRYDLVAFAGLITAAVTGLVPQDAVFSGFGHPAVVIIALVLIVSRGLQNSGVIEMAAARLVSSERPVPAHIGIMATTGAALSAVINNVAALALLMPLDIEAAKKAGRTVGRTLMPLSFGTILGGMVTLIGTPPNIVIAQYREDALGDPFTMFDFSPVGLAVALAGVIYVALLGWRLLPGRVGMAIGHEDFEKTIYMAELRIGDASQNVGRPLGELYPIAEEHDINLIGLVRRGRRLPGFSRLQSIQAGDFLVVEGAPDAIETFMGKADLEFVGVEKHDGGLTGGNLTLTEAIVPEGARISGRTARGLSLLMRHSVTLLGVGRSGRRFRERVRLLTIRPGDVLLLLGTPERLSAAMNWLGVLPLEGRRTGLMQRRKAPLAIGAFALAIALSATGLVYLPVALAACAAFYCAIGLVGGTEVYEAVEWKVIVLLASLIPMGTAFEETGGAQLVAGAILDLTGSAPAWVTMLALMAVTMTLSDFLNNVATALIAAPVAVQIAHATDTNPDAYLMGVAVAASCAFLTPIGHKNNTIIMGPGGYRFGDYWRVGLPLELLVLAVGIPAILTFWPL